MPFVLEDGWIHVSGQIPLRNGQVICRGLVGQDIAVEEAYQPARQCALQAPGLLAQASGDLDGSASYGCLLRRNREPEKFCPNQGAGTISGAHKASESHGATRSILDVGPSPLREQDRANIGPLL